MKQMSIFDVLDGPLSFEDQISEALQTLDDQTKNSFNKAPDVFAYTDKDLGNFYIDAEGFRFIFIEPKKDFNIITPNKKESKIPLDFCVTLWKRYLTRYTLRKPEKIENIEDMVKINNVFFAKKIFLHLMVFLKSNMFKVSESQTFGVFFDGETPQGLLMALKYQV